MRKLEQTKAPQVVRKIILGQITEQGRELLKISMDSRNLRAQILILIVGQEVKTTRIREEAHLIKADRLQHSLTTKKQSIQVLIKMVLPGQIRVRIAAATKLTKISLASVLAKIRSRISGLVRKRVPLIIEMELLWAPTQETRCIHTKAKSSLRVKFRLS